MRQVEPFSNVIDLTEARRAKLAALSQEEVTIQKGRVARAAGYVLLAASLAFGAYFAYRAADLGVLGDTFVLWSVVVTGVYAIGSVAFIRLMGGLNGAPLLSSVRVSAGDEVASRSDEEDESPVILPFRRRGRFFSVSCETCGTEYRATATDVSCPACGIAQAG